MRFLNKIYCYIQIFKINEIRRENGESVKGRLDSIAERRIPVSRTFSVPECRSTSRKDAMTFVPQGQCERQSYFLDQGT